MNMKEHILAALQEQFEIWQELLATLIYLKSCRFSLLRGTRTLGDQHRA
jgi:hypothetical protein